MNTELQFLLYDDPAEKGNINVVVKDDTIWATQKTIAELYEVQTPAISKHLKNIYEEGELEESSTISKMEIVVNRGFRGAVKEEMIFYNLDAIISVGYRVNSIRATQFRQWATSVLRQYAIRGYVIDRKRMENGTFLGEDYFEHLLAEIREIRLSERRFYQKITDIYATAIDYDKNAKSTKRFYATVQNKMHFAVHGHTAAELIYSRANSTKDNMGLTSWKNSPNGKILETDLVIAKNYLSKEELESLELIVSAFLDLAENRAKRHIPMTMSDWEERLNGFLRVWDREVLQDSGKISAELAKMHALTEFEKYRVIQDRLYESDFDKYISDIEEQTKSIAEDE